MDVSVSLSEIDCVKTSYGFGEDDIYIITELYDFGNATRPLLGRSLSHIGNMNDSNHQKKTARDNPHLKIPGDKDNYLLWLQNVSFDSLTCIMIVIKAGPLTSYDVGPKDPVDTSGEAQKAEADISSSLVKYVEDQRDELEKELGHLQDDLKKAAGQNLINL